MVESKKKISNIYIHSFRGVPNELTVDFTDKNGKAVSTIIYGDNGSGKSSIVDALEFNLQGRIERSTMINNPVRASANSLNYVPSIGSSTIVTFEDGTKSERNINVIIKHNTLKYYSDNKFLHEDFALAPIVLRRNDIISYSIIPGEKRQVLFLSFLYSQFIKLDDVEKNSIHWEHDPYITSLKDKYILLKRQRRELASRLAILCNTKVSKLPYENSEKLKSIIYNNLGLKGFQRKNNGKVKTIPSKNNTVNFNLVSNTIEEIDSISNEIKRISNEAEKALNPNNYGILVNQRREANAELIKAASDYLSDAFNDISTVDYISDLYLEIGNKTSASFDIIVKLANGIKTTPNKVFSEGNYDLLILLLYLSLIRACVKSGQKPILILDDILQSIDSTIRAKFIYYVVKNCKDWQLFITCHDELWLSQLRHTFSSLGHSFKELRLTGWTFEKGPTVEETKTKGEDKSLQKAIVTGDKCIIASQAGVFLENICQKLSVSLGISIQRKQNDKYTIGDLWPGVMKVFKGTNIYQLAEQINNELLIRNLLGCHANSWALSMSDSEVLLFAQHLLKFYEAVFCKKCNTWVTNLTSSGTVICECKCRNLQFVKQNV